MTTPILSCVEVASSPNARPNPELLTIKCYVYSSATSSALTPDRHLAVQAMTLLMLLDTEIRYARADWNEDRFRRLMRLRLRAVARIRRRWEKVTPQPHIPLGSLRRQYHANIAGHLYSVSQD